MATGMKTGIDSIRSNTQLLSSSNLMSPARRKAILTIAKKNNISFKDAQFRQALRISQAMARK